MAPKADAPATAGDGGGYRGLPDPGPAYEGSLGRTRSGFRHVGCDCGHVFAADVHSTIDVSRDEGLLARFRAGDLDRLQCPSCGAQLRPQLPRVFHDPRIPTFVLAVPPALRHRELQLRCEMLQALAEAGHDVPRYVKHLHVVYRPEQLDRLLAQPSRSERQARRAEGLATVEARAEQVERRAEELAAREEDLQAKERDLRLSEQHLDELAAKLRGEEQELQRERESLRTLALDLAAREEVLRQRNRQLAGHPPSGQPGRGDSDSDGQVDGEALAAHRPEQEIDRWRASDSRTGVFFHAGRVFLAARVEGEGASRLTETPPQLWLQLHELDGDPLPAIVAIDVVESQPVARASWLLDLKDEVVRRLLAQLSASFVLELDIYDEESRLLARWPLRAPLEKNVELLLERADALESEGAGADFEELCRRFWALSPGDRIGRKKHNFSRDSFIDLPTPAAGRLALGIVRYWSEPENERYLLLVKSFGADHWAAIRRRVVQAALEHGLWIGGDLGRFAVAEGLVGSVQQAVRTAIANFAEVSLHLKPSDLDPTHESDNWKQLLAAALEHDVVVEPQIEELARAAERRARAATPPPEEEAIPGGDLSALAEAKLLQLLGERETRRDAALELCERGVPSTAGALFAAVQNMTRGEVARVMPAMLQLGDAVVPLFEQGLSHRKSFIRQGSALGLCALGSTASSGALIDLLLSEPSRMWREVARAIGRLGEDALAPLLAAVESANAEQRERLAWAAGYAADEDPAAAERLRRAPESRDQAPLIARATELLSRMQAERGPSATARRSEQTIVHRFTERFLAALSADVNELGEDDILDEEEVLDEGDILGAAPLVDGVEDGESEAGQAASDDDDDEAAFEVDAETVEVDDDDIIYAPEDRP